MQRVYDVRTAALATGTTAKWVDNLLSHHQLPGVAQGRQGVQRQLSDIGLVAIELTRLLHERAAIPVWKAAQLAVTCLAIERDIAHITIGDDVTLVVDIASVQRRLHHAVVAAMEATVRVRRGRPRRA